MTIELSLNYWDCECVHHYIHPNCVYTCELCGSLQDEQPPSRVTEVIQLYPDMEGWYTENNQKASIMKTTTQQYQDKFMHLAPTVLRVSYNALQQQVTYLENPMLGEDDFVYAMIDKTLINTGDYDLPEIGVEDYEPVLIAGEAHCYFEL